MLSFFQNINNVLWNYFLIFILFGTGIYLTCSFKFVQVRKFHYAIKKFFGNFSLKGKKANKRGMSSFQALATAVASQIGAGNLGGAATAIVSGGPGAIFWMWVSGFFGMSTIFSEATLAQIYKKDINGETVGGPSFYIEDGMKNKKLASFFAGAYLIFGIFDNMVQSNTAGKAISNSFHIPNLATGFIIALLSAIVVMGGISMLASVTEKLVPIMALGFSIGAFIIIFSNIPAVGRAFKSIFVCAFNAKAAAGGVIGYTVKQTIRYGVARGLYSNEAGMGTTPHAHAVAKVEHPAEQGLAAIVGLFIDTFVVLTLCALVILSSGVSDGKITGIELVQKAFCSHFGKSGSYFITVSLFFFVYSTIISIFFFTESEFKYLFKGKNVKGKKHGLNIYRIIMLIFVTIAPCLDVPLVWEMTDTFNAVIIIPNIIALICLVKVTKKSLYEYEDLIKQDYINNKISVIK